MADDVAAMPYVDLQKSGDTSDARARASYLKSGFVSEITPALVDDMVEGFEPSSDRLTFLGFQQGGGLINQVDTSATAFVQRDSVANLLHAVDWASDQDGSTHVDWIKNAWTSLEPHTQGFYVNDGDPDDYDGANFVNRSYGENYSQLVEIKNRYDPRNLFRLNANVLPSV